MAANAFTDALTQLDLSRDDLNPILDHVNDNSHHPDFEADYEAVKGGGDPSNANVFLTRVFGDIYRLGHDLERLKLSPQYFAEHNCEIEEAIEEQLSFANWDGREQYDLCEDIILSYIDENLANRSEKKLKDWIENNRADDWGTLGDSPDDIWENVISMFGYANFFLQQGPREAVLAAYQERNDHEEMFKPLDDIDDIVTFPKHTLGNLIAKAYGGQTTVMGHDVDGKKIVSKEIPGDFADLKEFSDDFPPNEVATNRAIQEYFKSLAPHLNDNCPFIIEMVGVTREDTDSGSSYYYYMEGGEGLFEWVSTEYDNQKKDWTKTLKAKKAKWKDDKSPYHQKVTTFFIQILTAVQYMHMMKIAHRDLKLENVILVEKDGEQCAKLIDFGIAHRFSAGEEAKALDSVGTYQSPECSADGGYDAFKNDVWALGFMLYMLLAKAPPYLQNNNVDPGFRHNTKDSYVDDKNPKETMKNWLKKTKSLFMFTNDALDLLESIFCPEEDRFTMEDIFTHPWCSDEVEEMKDDGKLDCIASILDEWM